MSNRTEKTMEEWVEFVETVFEDDTYTSKVMFSVSLFVVFIISCVANLVICIVICNNKTMHTATNYYLFDLAVSDLLESFLILITAYKILTLENSIMDYQSGLITCKVFFCIQYLFISLLWNHGILVLTALSIERYFAICYPMMIYRAPMWKRVGKTIVVLWIIAVGETIPLIFTLEIKHYEKGLLCVLLPTHIAKSITTSSIIISFMIPLNVMIFVYTAIAVKVNDNQNTHLNFMMINNSIHKRSNVTLLICALTVSFILSWLPYYAVRLILVFVDIRILAHFRAPFTILNKIAMFNILFTTVINPVLFSLISKKFRKAIKVLWDTKIKRNHVRARQIEIIEMKLETGVLN